MREDVIRARVFCLQYMGLPYLGGLKLDPPARIIDRYTKKDPAVPRVTVVMMGRIVPPVDRSVITMVFWIEMPCPMFVSGYAAALAVIH
jgi:hypothetical protein